MRIAINTRFLLSDKMEGFGWFTYEVVKRISEQHPEHTFLFFFDRKYDPNFIFSSNVKPIVISPPARHPFLFLIWFNIGVSMALRKHKADLFFSPDGYLSLTTSVPQIPVIHDLNFEYYPEDLPLLTRLYYRYFFPRFAEKAVQIITVSNYSKQDIHLKYGIPSEKITVSWNGASEAYMPLSMNEIEEIRNKYTKGKPYFLFVGSLHPRKNLNRLLEAYLQFKSEIPSNDYELIITGKSMWKKMGLDDSISSNHQIHFTGHLPQKELIRVMGAAAIFVYVPYFEGFGIPIVEAMRCGIPVISGNKTSLPEVAGDAALYADPFSVTSIVDAMKKLVTNPTLYNELKTKAKERSEVFSWDKTAEICWNVIEKCLNEKH